MKFQISIFNTSTGNKDVLYICNEIHVVHRQQQAEQLVKHSAFEIVLTELVK